MMLNESRGKKAIISKIDINEQALAKNLPKVLDVLLADMTTGRNIVWATENYVHLGSKFSAMNAITKAAITGDNLGVIRPRIDKTEEQRWIRTKGMAEVFTPSWICNLQNNGVDEAWFGSANIFNKVVGRGWRTNHGPVRFDQTGTRTWRKYVDNRCLEVACGEAPYVVSRYDATTGKSIPLARRIGILDRKLRVVTENAKTEDEWLSWARRAFESVYAFEFQGDSLLLARENLFATYQDYFAEALGRTPSENELLRIARIISWNVWQMDAFTRAVPFSNTNIFVPASQKQNLIGIASPACQIRDWRGKRTIEFRSLFKERQEND